MKFIDMKVKGVMFDPSTFVPIVMLKDDEGKKTLPLWVSILEAASILMKLEGIESEQPSTHDILNGVITSLGSKVINVAITELKDSVFYSSIKLSTDSGEIIEIDARPSDAIALAIKCDLPVKVREGVIEKSRVIDVAADNVNFASKNDLMNILENLPIEEFGKYKM